MDNSIDLKIMMLPHGEGLELPSYATAGSSGMDLRAAILEGKLIQPGRRVIVPTGVCIGLPDGYEAQVRPRSGLAAKQGVTVLNTPGTVDSDYRGEIKIILANLGDETVTIFRGDRIAQMVIAPVTRANLQVVTSLDETDRGAGGFGSTGSK